MYQLPMVRIYLESKFEKCVEFPNKYLYLHTPIHNKLK